jgi:uncharacterized membrane protein
MEDEHEKIEKNIKYSAYFMIIIGAITIATRFIKNVEWTTFSIFKLCLGIALIAYGIRQLMRK